MTTPPVSPLHELAAAHGVDVEFWDWRGEKRRVDDATVVSVLAALGVDAAGAEAQRAALAAHRRADAEPSLPPCVVLREGQATTLTAPEGATTVELEDGGRRDVARTATAISLPADLPTGYHRLVVRADTGAQHAQLIVTPDRLALPAGFDSPGWGLAVQLYSVLSRRSWGVGDLGDLARLAAWVAGEHGADFVLVNPLHAAEVVAPMDPSPYSPTTRRFANPIYLDVPAVARRLGADAALLARVDGHGAPLREHALPDGLIDRDAAWAAKRDALGELFASAWPAASDVDARAFADFCTHEGDELTRFTTWCALTEVHGGDWRAWPEALHDPHGAAVRDAANDVRGRVEFYRWLQWLLDGQLTDAQQAARDAGARLGIVHDVAVGVSPDGADSWSWQDTLAAGASVGAPPDAYSQLGQDWHQPPWRPDRLAALGYAPVRDMFRAALRHCGGLRVDHVMGLFRLWWIPAGATADAGTYVHYDHEAMLGVLLLEAQRAGAVIIGEDLGNVEPWVHDYLRERGVFGTSILWFESDHRTGEPLPPQRWREQCLASVTTHDLPPTVGYLAGDHIRLRDKLGLLTRSVDDELTADRKDKQAWLAELTRCGVLPAGTAPDDPAVVAALHAFLKLTPALLRGVALTDAVGERRTQNQPGTRDEYPNWRIPLGDARGDVVLLDDVVVDPQVGARLDAARD